MVGEKEDSRAEARFASWAWVHFDSRWRGFGVVVVLLGVVDKDKEVEDKGVDMDVDVGGAWILGIEGCFNTGGIVAEARFRDVARSAVGVGGL